VRGLSDKALAAKILDDEIDILVDLTGHSAHNRLLVFARKPAPIQVTWAGYVGTTGLSAIDYLISDQYSTHADEEKFYSETVVRMPDGWLCYDPPGYAPEVGPLPFIENTYVTFASFSNPAKINEEVVDTWADILADVENSRLLIKYKSINSEHNSKRLIKLFEAKGVDRSRLTLEGQSPHVELLARYNDVDIALDPFPYSGGLTTYEALWMGVPVITTPGQTFASRHSFSHLSTIGLPELIAKDRNDYIRLAIELANDVGKIANLRAGLRNRMANSPICDVDRFAAGFTTVMQRIWRDWSLNQSMGNQSGT
jgi:protein O-GlcNAc transferase